MKKIWINIKKWIKNNKSINNFGFMFKKSFLNIKYLKYSFQSKKQTQDFFIKNIIRLCILISVIALITLISFVVYKASYAIGKVGMWKFLTTGVWSSADSRFGIIRILFSTIIIISLSLLFAVPLSIFGSLYICEYLSPSLKRKVTNIIQLLAGIPSVVFGLFGIYILGNLFQLLGASSSNTLITTSLILAFMAIPIMMSLSINAIDAIPDTYRFNSMALGTTKAVTTFRVVYKAAKVKIIAAIIMGIARMVGETMAVLMICGNNVNGPNLKSGFLGFIFSTVASLASTIGIQMLDNTGKLHESALYTIGMVLFILVIIINIIVLLVTNYNTNKHKKKPRTISDTNTNVSNHKIYNLIQQNFSKNYKINKIITIIAMFFMITSTFIIVSMTLTIVGTVIYNGLFLMNINDYISITSNNQGAGILAASLTTLLLVICTMLIALPLALGSAIYFNEYADQNSIVTKSLRFMMNILASTPSIIFGMFGLMLFVNYMHLSLSIFSAGLTLTIVILPMMIRNIEDSLSLVPLELRQSSLSLGINKSRTISKVVLPKAMPGITTATILGMSRVIGESAPVYLTLGTTAFLPAYGFFSPGSSLTTQILSIFNTGVNNNSVHMMFELGFVTLLLILILNTTANHISYRYSDRYVKRTFKDKIKNVKNKIVNFDIKEYSNKSAKWMKPYIEKWEKKKKNEK